MPDEKIFRACDFKIFTYCPHDANFALEAARSADPEIPQQRICRRKDGCGKCVWHR